MEIRVTKNNFLKAAALVTGVTAQKANTLPILGANCVLLGRI
jgi:hypothetical protein